MSADPYCKLYFLVNDDPYVLSIPTYADWDIDDLKMAIMNKAGLGHLKPSDIILRKLHDPIKIKPVGTLTDRLPSSISDSSVVLEEPTDAVSDVFPRNLAKGHLYIIVLCTTGRPDIKGKRKADAEPDADHEQRQKNVGAPEDSKRLKIDGAQGYEDMRDRRLPSEATLQDYHKMFQHLSDDPQWYSNPENCYCIPFPFSFSEPPERFSVQDGKFEYMGREAFRGVHNTVSSLKTGGGGTRLYIQGTMGYGKSHILAALACLLYRQGKLVVFIPDVRALLLAPLPYITTALLCTFAGPSFKEERKQIRACKSMDDISSFYHGIRSFPYLIVDQINAFELSDPNTDSVSRETKDACRIFINDLSVGSFTITSASANYQTAMHMEKQTNEIKLSMMGGMSTEEMKQWWHHYEDKLPKFENVEERVEVEELTGRIPLLLRPLLWFCQQKYRSVERDCWACPEIQDVQQNIEQFSESKRKIGEREYNDYIETLCSCIIRGGIFGHPNDSFDYRYFYRDGRNCDYTCGLAREAAISVIARRKHGKFYEPEWINSLRFYQNNPAALGNQVELICLACIADMGINHGDIHIKSKIPVRFVGNLDSLLDIIPSDLPPGFFQLYVPENPRFEDIDGVYVEYNHNSDTVHVIPMQVTINARHKDSETLFYNKWAKWKSKFFKHKLTSTFAWIVETEVSWGGVKETTRKTRQMTQVITPNHMSASIPLVKVHLPLANELARIRKATT